MSHSDDRHDLHEIISTITHQLTGLGKDSSIVTLAGSNKGAIMKADGGELLNDNATDNNVNHRGEDSTSKLSAYTNSNYQAVNNSIMVDGRCEAEDPGVHIEIVDCIDIQEEGDDEQDWNNKKTKKKYKKKNEKKGTDHEEDEEADEHEKEGKEKKKEKN